MKYFFLTSAIIGFVAGSAFSQTAIKNLVFEGGGIRGIAYVGALQELEDRKMLDSIERVAGTSAGAITATLFALGYSPSEMAQLIAELNLKKFADGRGAFIGGTRRLVKYYGWHRGQQFQEWLGECIRRKTGKEHLTFRELEDLTANGNRFKKLFITGTSLSEQKLTVFSHSTFPEMEIRAAVRISISIPLFFEAVVIDESGKVIKKKKDQVKGYVMVDGGVIGNYPIRIFDYSCYAYPDGDSTQTINRQTLGFRLDREEQIAFDQENKGLAPYNIDKFQDYLQAFYTILLENLNRQHLSPDDWKRTVSISTGEIGPKIRRLSANEKKVLIENGRKGVCNYLSKQN